MTKKSYLKGRGAQKNTPNKFLKDIHEMREDFLEFCRVEGEIPEDNKTQYLPIFPKTIVNKVPSPDVGMEYSM
ncbi:MAG: radical SAM protein, partial [Flavobacteriaceae bacterium]